MSEIPNPDMLDFKKHLVESAGHDIVKVPFELTPYDFLEFAATDLQERSERNAVNALGNIKRSIDCLCDGLLYVMDLLEKSKEERWTFPQKIDFLGEIGIIAPYVLKRINSMRNLLEHEFRRPKWGEVEDAFDAANLFCYATNRLTKRFPIEFYIEDENEKLVLMIKFDRKERRLHLEDSSGKSFELREETPEYAAWLRKFFQIQYLLM